MGEQVVGAELVRLLRRLADCLRALVRLARALSKHCSAARVLPAAANFSPSWLRSITAPPITTMWLAGHAGVKATFRPHLRPVRTVSSTTPRPS
jgi:hypothetical protein